MSGRYGQRGTKRHQQFVDDDCSAKRSRDSLPQNREQLHGIPSLFQSPPYSRHLSTSDTRDRPQAGASWSKVTTSILHHFQQTQQNQDVYARKVNLRDALFKIVKNIFPSGGLFMVGSSMNGFGSITSDMDLCLMLSHDQIQKNEAFAILRSLQQSFRKCNFMKNLLVINAKVPILKFCDTLSGIECDLNINNSTGIRNTHLLCAYAKLDRRLPPLVLFIKRWAKFQNINNASQASLSSYSLVLMVIHYLQVGCSPPVLSSLQELYPEIFSASKDVRMLPLSDKIPRYTSPNTQTLGELLYGFLNYYANIFNFDVDGISVRLGTKLSRRVLATQDMQSQWKFICIEEPFDLSNTARSVHNEFVFERIKRVFRRSYSSLATRRDVDHILTVPM